MTKEEANLKVIQELNNKGYDAIDMDFNLLNDFADILYKAINYTRCCKSDSELLSCKCGLPKRKQGIGFSCMRTDCDANTIT